eukprot:CCRYP_018420-RA/>CCRYP_018420-RA protein AED:0.44 eAED:0.44 QI:0/-1/0/1/-1/1/1/0/59
MSSVKAFPEGLKWIECERGIGGKNSPSLHSRAGSRAGCPGEDQKTTYFKLTLPNTGNEL